MIALGLLRSIRVGWAEHAASALLQDEDTPSPAVRVIAAVYWPLAAAIYLTRSFGIGDWQIRWITWPIAGALYVALWGMNMALVGDRADADPRAPAAEPHLRAHKGGAFGRPRRCARWPWRRRCLAGPIPGALYAALWRMGGALVAARAAAAPGAPAAEPHLRARQGGAFARVLRRLLGEKPHGTPPPP